MACGAFIQVLDLADLTGVHLSEGSAAAGEILEKGKHAAPLHQPVAGDHSVGGYGQLVHPEVDGAVFHKGIDFPELDDPLDFSLKAFASTKDNRVSMLQDVEAGRPTEIGNLNEVIVSEGRRYSIPTPYNEAVSWLTRGVEERNRQKRFVTESGNESEAVRNAIKKEDLEALRGALEASPLARALSIRFTEFEAGRATARLPGTAQLPNFLGYTHTGALFTLAEQTMAAVANSLGHVGLPLNCDIQFLNAADPAKDVIASARVIDTQGRIARVQVEITQDGQTVAKVSEMVFLRKK